MKKKPNFSAKFEDDFRAMLTRLSNESGMTATELIERCVILMHKNAIADAKLEEAEREKLISSGSGEALKKAFFKAQLDTAPQKPLGGFPGKPGPSKKK